MRILRKLKRFIKVWFEPWQDRDKAKAEVQEIRCKAKPITIMPNPNQETRRLGESQIDWQKRRDE